MAVFPVPFCSSLLPPSSPPSPPPPHSDLSRHGIRYSHERALVQQGTSPGASHLFQPMFRLWSHSFSPANSRSNKSLCRKSIPMTSCSKVCSLLPRSHLASPFNPIRHSTLLRYVCLRRIYSGFSSILMFLSIYVQVYAGRTSIFTRANSFPNFQ